MIFKIYPIEAVNKTTTKFVGRFICIFLKDELNSFRRDFLFLFFTYLSTYLPRYLRSFEVFIPHLYENVRISKSGDRVGKVPT